MIPVRIDEADPLSRPHVGDDHVLDQRRLSHAGLLDHIQVPLPSADATAWPVLRATSGNWPVVALQDCELAVWI